MGDCAACLAELCDIVVGFFYSSYIIILFLSGGGEINPAPPTHEQLTAILKNQKAFSSELKLSRAKLHSHLSDPKKRLASIQGNIKSLSQTARRVHNCQHALTKKNDRILLLMSKIHDPEIAVIKTI